MARDPKQPDPLLTLIGWVLFIGFAILLIRKLMGK